MCWPLCENCRQLIPKAYFKLPIDEPFICECGRYYWRDDPEKPKPNIYPKLGLAATREYPRN